MSFIVYTKPACPFCDKAKHLLNTKGLSYTEVIFDVGQPRVEGKQYVSPQEFKAQYPEAKTAPQIFYGEDRIGGYSELVAHLVQ